MLSGGIGNQLFQYAWGLYLQESKGIKQVSFVHLQSKSDCDSIQKLAEAISIEPIFSSSLFYKITHFLVREDLGFRRTRKAIRKICFKLSLEKELLGVNPTLRVGDSFLGYFQKYPFFTIETLELMRKRINLEKISIPEEIVSLGTSSENIVLHIRRGDYMNFVDSIGALSTDYFYRAVVQAQEVKANLQKVVVVTDEEGLRIPDLEKLCGEINFHYLYPSNLKAMQALKLMTISPNLVLSNSTLSLWASYLGGGKNLLILPTPWFRSLSSQGLLFMENSRFTPSSWLNYTK